MCKAYERRWTYHARDIKKSQCEKKKRKETFSIGWLKTFQAISKIDFILFCQKAILSNAEEVQELYFDGHSRKVINLTANTLASVTNKAKSKVSLKNPLRWLHVNTHILCSKFGWLIHNVMQYEKNEVLDELAKEGTQ